ncbi:hypothetical protein [Chryseobacterium aquaticum]|uniref:hypothetical protein n=1 Tax=Chryseobacterium aquaticum TaxID=452084 RepID=UPI003F715532
MKKIILACTLTFLTFSSCQDDRNEIAAKDLAKTEETNKIAFRQYGNGVSNDEILRENLEKFYNENKIFAERIAQILDENPNFENNEDFQNDISQATNQQQIINVFESHGITNKSQDLLTIINEENILSEQFSIANPYLYELDQATRDQIINDIQLNDAESVSTYRSCYEQYQIDRKRCLRNHAIRSLVVVASAPFTAGISVALGTAAAIGLYALCLGDANDDYAACH